MSALQDTGLSVINIIFRWKGTDVDSVEFFLSFCKVFIKVIHYLADNQNALFIINQLLNPPIRID